MAVKDPKSVELREALFRAAVRRDPESTVLQWAFASQVLSTFATRCVGEAVKVCEKDVLGAAAALDRVSPESSGGSELRASFYSLTGRFEEADRVLSARCPELNEPAQGKCWGALLAAVPRKRENRALIDRVVRRSVKSACLMDEGCEAVLIRAGDVMAELGEWLDALAYFERAVAKAPSVPSFLKVADMAQALGRMNIAQRALDLAASRAASDPALARLVEARRRALHQLTNQ
jgi:tetratricopeptide (TPR) repeat protein